MTTADDHDDKLQVASSLFDAYRQDQAVGILDIRLRWEEVSDEVLIIAAGWAGSAEQELATPDRATLFGTAGYDWAFFVEAQNTIGFHQILETVVEHRGDPPATEILRRYALDILRGRIHLAGAIRLVCADTELLACLPDIYQTFLPGIDPRKYPILSQAVRVAAAAALPRSELFRLRGLAPGNQTDAATKLDSKHLNEIREEYQRVMAEAESSKDVADPAREEELLIHALDLAEQSPEPDDDIEVLQRILRLAERFPVSPEALKRCSDAVDSLVVNGHVSQAVARCLTALADVIQRQGLMEELGQIVVAAGSRLLEEALDSELQLALKTAVAQAWLGLGRNERARALLKEVDEARLSPQDRLNVALMTADSLQSKSDADRAADVLITALQEASSENPASRLPTLQKLMAVWPESRSNDELLPFVDELLETARTLKEPRRTLCLVGTALRLWPSGRKVHALRAWSMIDEERIRRETPPMMAEKVLGVIERAKQKLDTSQAETVAH
ncbi:hypothetical protein ACFL51_01075 [Myxococcota bacterium]